MNILHLEMSQFFSRVIEKVAVESGYTYRNEVSVQAGLAAINEWKFDLLITAHILEDGRAENLLREIPKTANRDLPVIVITADDSLENRERFFSLGVMDYLQKSDLVPQKLKLYFEVINRGGEILEELKSLRVAVLDDSNVSLHVIRSIFQYYGVDHTEYFRSPRDMLAAGHFDLYIIDMVMPEMTGDEVLLAIQERRGHPGIIVVSGVSNRLAMAHALQLGADDYIAKPFDARDFIARVKGVVRHLLLLRELEDKSRQMEELARRDSLTGLWNHRSIHEILEHATGADDPAKLSIILFDLDNFKSVNDRYGHQAGDDVLLAVTDVFTREIGAVGEIGRYGGEEFLIVLPGFELDRTRELANHLIRHIRSLEPIRKEFPITASGGIASIEERQDAMKLVELADDRLYQAKRAGKDRIVG